jgi:hypothetical protein
VNIINNSGLKNLKNRYYGSGDGLRFFKPSQLDPTRIPYTPFIFILDNFWIENLF